MKIEATLNIAGESDGMKKRRSELSIPIIAAATASVRQERQHDRASARW